MTIITTPRYGMPLLAPGQADKELTHNEALALIDVMLQPVVQAVGTRAPPSSPSAGQCWIVGAGPSGPWAGHGDSLAVWTDGGWRFVVPAEGFVAWDVSRAIPIVYRSGLWQQNDVRGVRLMIAGQQVVGARAAGIADPTGGSIVDDAARTAIVAILSALRSHGLIAPS